MTSKKRTGGNKLDRLMLWCEYAIFLPLLVHLPLRLGYRLAALRGRMNWALDREWRSVALGQHYIRSATDEAMQQLRPYLSSSEIQGLTRRRFEGVSREEFEAYLLIKGKANGLHFSVKGLEGVREQVARGRGVVLLTTHFDSFILGIVFLGMSGLVVNVMTSEVVENPLVSPCVRLFFSMKYRGMERYLQGGKALHVEHHLRFFYRALLSGECVVVLADLPTPTPDDQRVWLRFLGRERSFLSGAFRLARRTGSAVTGFVCSCEGTGRYAVDLYKCVQPAEVNQASFQEIYSFLDEAIRRNPERWWAADLIRAYESR